MFWYYFKAAVKNLTNNKKFSAINITGFAFGISICLTITLFLAKEYSYDRFHEHAGQIVRLIDTKKNSSSIDYRVKDILLNNYSEIENACLVQRVSDAIEVKIDDEGFYLDDILSVDNAFFEVFSIGFVSGKSSSPFVNIQSAVITESTAKTLFGTGNPLGRNLLIWGTDPVTITAVIRDFPENSSISAGLLVNAENEAFKFSFSCGDYKDKSSHRWPFRIYLQLNENVHPELLASKLNSDKNLLKPYTDEVSFLGLKDIYLHDKTHGSDTKQGNPGLLKLLTVIAVIILALAVINYINLTIAQQNKRNKDTGVKKTIGATRINIFSQFLSESVLVTFLAFILGVVLAWMFLPFTRSVLNTNLDFNLLFCRPYFPILLGSVLLIGLISGSGPAVILSAVAPVKVLSGSAVFIGQKSYLRNSLTVFQFMISIVLIFCVMIVDRQIQYVKHKNPGFYKEQLLRLDVPTIQGNDVQKAMVLLDEFRKSPYIKNVSVSQSVPGEVRMSMGSNIKDSDKNMSVPCLLADTAFLQTFGIKVIKGRNLRPGDYGKVCMINEAAYKHFEFEDLNNKRFNNFGGFDIIAVVNDFHFRSLHKTIGPACIMFTPQFEPRAINIRFAGNSVGRGMEFIRDTWKDILPGYPLKYQFYDEWFDSMYRSEERFAKTIGLFAVLAIIISSIGILGLATFSSERRIKEIGIRKVNGARVSEILAMLNKDFVKWVVIAFVVATPVAYYAMHKWLESFAYKTELSWWIFALAGLLALGIALLTVSWQSWKAATRNPVEALRYE
ncbi:MAG: ABC transporter permease [Mangrovibacterium sp.]|nr:ABC transporter permease [Mangrovibacterium sp.]